MCAKKIQIHSLRGEHCICLRAVCLLSNHEQFLYCLCNSAVICAFIDLLMLIQRKTQLIKGQVLNYFMAISASGPAEPNPLLWSATWASINTSIEFLLNTVAIREVKLDCMTSFHLNLCGLKHRIARHYNAELQQPHYLQWPSLPFKSVQR